MSGTAKSVECSVQNQHNLTFAISVKLRNKARKPNANGAQWKCIWHVLRVNLWTTSLRWSFYMIQDNVHESQQSIHDMQHLYQLQSLKKVVEDGKNSYPNPNETKGA
ncbi:hypothetical protein PM082_006527 [Marasmius tenuissimus]|nr:hypothetical protein PM082_006527 [Marasmius tenuissimus]